MGLEFIITLQRELKTKLEEKQHPFTCLLLRKGAKELGPNFTDFTPILFHPDSQL